MSRISYTFRTIEVAGQTSIVLKNGLQLEQKIPNLRYLVLHDVWSASGITEIFESAQSVQATTTALRLSVGLCQYPKLSLSRLLGLQTLTFGRC
ncbi:hypothetical protein ASC90_27110 [Rhizobium sp. Root1220]|nr:hypothetical protein ASC90_27110 [Rhizobium sp. Root1220]